MRRALVLAILAAGACSADGAVDLTIALDPSVPDATVARIAALSLDVSGLATEMVSDPLAQPFATNREERVVVRSAAAGLVTIAVTARDAAGAPLLYGQTSFALEPGQESSQTVTLSAAVVIPDGGMDLAPADLAAIDLAAGDLGAGDLAETDLAQIVCPTGVLLCDGFESGTIDPVIWDQSTTTTVGTVTPDNTRAHRGAWSLHLHTSAITSGGTAIATVGENHTFTSAGQTFFVRAYYYFPSGTASTAVATLLDASQTSGAGDDVSLAIDHDALSMYDGFAAGAYTASTTPLVPLDAWTCVEWEVDTGTPNQMHAWVNGTQVTQLDLMEATTGTPQIGGLDVGLGIYPPNASTAALDVWLDDVIVDRARIGCAR
jgi:hypothetical protein